MDLEIRTILHVLTAAEMRRNQIWPNVWRLLLFWILNLVVAAETSGSIDDEKGVISATSHLQRQRNLQTDKSLMTIVGGMPAETDEFGYFVQGQGCGGSLIWYDIVLTAAHCLIPGPLNAWDGRNATIGSYKNGQLTPGAEQIKVRGSVQHRSFRIRTINFDYGIVWLERPIRKKHPFAKLNWSKSNPATNATLTVAGFGYTSANGDKTEAELLQKVNVPAVPYQACKAAYSDIYAIDDKTQFCAGSKGRDACQGDSGGPIVDGNGRQVGIVSTGRRCGSAQYPGIYSRISSSASWIWRRVCQYSERPPLKRCKALRQRRRRRRNNERRAMFALNSTVGTTRQCDDTKYLFGFGETIKSKDCRWLAHNLVHAGEQLCDYDHIAFRCPATCESCNRFE